MTKSLCMRLCFPFYFFFLSTPLFSESSLLFSKAEQASILSKRDRNRRDTLTNKEGCLECNGLIFQDLDNWSVWINGQKFDTSCPACPIQNLKIFNIEKNEVHLEWLYKGETHLIILAPNQYYNARLSRVITMTEPL